MIELIDDTLTLYLQIQLLVHHLLIGGEITYFSQYIIHNQFVGFVIHDFVHSLNDLLALLKFVPKFLDSLLEFRDGRDHLMI